MFRGGRGKLLLELILPIWLVFGHENAENGEGGTLNLTEQLTYFERIR
jgi:hypothetical protein